MAKIVNQEVFETMPVKKAVRSFVVPALLSMLITIIYSLADTIYVGMLGDPVQVAALAVVFPIYQLLNAFGSLFGLGTNSIMSRAMGEKNVDRASRASALGLWSSVVFMAVMCTLLSFFMDPVITLGGSSSDNLIYARRYLTWTFVIGGIPTVASIVMCNLLRAEGEAKKAGFGLMLGGVLNCIFDPIFIFVLHQDVVGAAMATALCNLISLIYFLCIYYKKMKPTSLICLSPFRYGFDGRLMKDITLVGLPSCCLTILGATGNFVNNHLLSGYGDIAVASSGIVQKVAFIGIYSTHGVSQGVLPLIGYNYGAKNFERVRGVNKEAIKILLTVSVTLLALVEIFPQGFARIFINDYETVSVASTMLRVYMICMPFMSMILMTSTLCQAVGKWKHSLAMLALRQLIVNIPLMFLLDRFVWSMYGVVMSQPCCDFICLFIAVYVYRSVFVKAMKETSDLMRN